MSASASQGICTQSSGTVTCSLGTLAAGAAATMSITVTAGGKGTIANTATVQANEPDPNPANNASTTSTQVAGLVGSAEGEQIGFSVLGLTVGSTPTPSVTLPAGGGGPVTGSAASVGLSSLLGFATLQATTQGGGSGTTMTVTSSAGVAKSAIGIAGVATQAVRSQCSATPAAATGSSSVTGLTINGKAASSTGGPIAISGIGTLRLNEQVTSAGVLTVNAMHLVLNGALGSGDIVVGQSQCGLAY